MAVDLPPNLIRYFEAQNAHDLDAMTESFAPDAQVRDEGRTYVGRQAIRDWKRETSARYAATARPLHSSAQDGKLTVVAEVAGNFPGSPANLTYRFAVDGEGLIRELEIG